jgi:hypothetical protein
VVFWTPEGADAHAKRCAEMHDKCAIVAPVDLPLDHSVPLFVVLSDGTRKEIQL